MHLRAIVRHAVVLTLATGWLVPSHALGQRIERIPASLIRDVMPGADRFAETGRGASTRTSGIVTKLGVWLKEFF